MNRLFLFDFDGVIADSLEIFARIFVEQCQSVGLSQIATRKDFLDLFDGNVFQGMRKAGFHPIKMRRLLKDFRPRINEAMAVARPFEGMPEVLTDAARDCPTYVVTSSMTEVVEGFLERYGMTGIRDVMGADREPSKVKKIKSAAQAHPDDTVYYIGDTRGDMVEGREAGAVTVAVTWGWHDEARLRSAPADHVVHTPEALRNLLLQD